MIKVVSLDFWGTIAVFNPDYAAARTEFLADLFGLPTEEAHTRYKSVKHHSDKQAETFGTAITPLVAVKRLLEGKKLTRPMSAVDVLAVTERLVLDYPPILHEEIPVLIDQLQQQDIHVGVSSNTNFIAGKLVESIYDLPWDFAVYSDELGVSKPDGDFFRTVLARGRDRAGAIPAHYFLHFGDNENCDVKGAMRVGMDARRVRSPDDTVKMLKRIVDGKELLEDAA
jgi:putative hydrolase of the HAD superfamily